MACLMNSRRLARVRHAVFSRVRFLKLESDVTDVVYMTWLVDAQAAQLLVPPGVKLWQRAGKTPFTALTYRHGHFGPAFLGGLRRLFPSPRQSNWRLYLDETQQEAVPPRTVYFVKNIMSSFSYAFVTRIFSDIMKTHLAEKFTHSGSRQAFNIDIRSGEGSSPSLTASTKGTDEKKLTPQFSALFGSWEQAVEHLACQDAAISCADRLNGMVMAEIQLPIDVKQVLPLDVAGDAVLCSFPEHLSGLEGPFCFVVPAVKFRVISERLF